MARLIPSFIDETSPPGERDVYNMLAAGPDDWTVLHSLDLAPWNSSRRTEIDFVAIIPDAGILCIEVKSHGSIDYDGERWYPASIKRSPFKQAMDAQFALLRRLCDLSPYAQGVPFLHCCIFPNARFEVRKNLSVSPWEVMDLDAFRSFKTSGEFCADLRRRLLEGTNDEGIRPLAAPIPPPRVMNLVELCVPIQKRRPSAAHEVRRRREDMEKCLHEQQRPVLRLAEWNDRLLVTGGAGTGKTLIAMELARRAAERGERVALVCYNRLVGDWMATKLSEGTPLPNLVVGSAMSLLMRMAGVSAPAAAGADYWAETVFLQLEERFTDPDLGATATFDYLIVDEAQDILGRPLLWECLTSLLTGGIETGRFALFGDVEHQVLGSRGALADSLDGIQAHARPVAWHLSENCRNFRMVGDSALRLSGFPANIYSGYLRTGGSNDDIAYATYRDPAEQLSTLKDLIQQAHAKGFKNRDITILSFTAPEKGVAARLRAQGHKLLPVQTATDEMRYSSVQAYKGMESPVVIVTDIDLAMDDLSRALFYTALTRSTSLVRVVCRNEDAARLLTWAGGQGA